jgi:hypothetical protein
MTKEERLKRLAQAKRDLRLASEEKKKRFPVLFALTEQLILECEDEYVSDQTIKDTVENIKKILTN